MSNKKMGKLIYVGIVLALLLVLLIPSSVVAEGGGVTCTVSANLIISNVYDSNITTSSATISWETNDNATSQVFYDTAWHNTAAEYAYHTTEDISLVSGHSVTLTGLSSSTTYHYRVRSAIDAQFIAISEDYTFTTSSPPPPSEEPPTYYTRTNLFGVWKSYRISRTGEILQTIEATSEDGMLTMTIPKGTIALDKDSKRLASLETAVDESPPDPVEDAHIIGLAYDFGPSRAMFSPQITLTWNYDPDVLPEGVTEESLIMAYYEEAVDEWTGLVCEVDTENNTITASVSHFTAFAIIGSVTPPPVPPPAPARFTIRSLGVSPSELAPDEEVNISVLVANTGGKSGSYSVFLKINGVKEAEERVTIAAGRSQTVTFSVTKEEPDTYAVTVDGWSDSFTVVAPLIILEPAAFSLSSLAVEPTGVKPGEAVTVSIVVANTGGTEGSYTLVLKIDGVKEAEEMITIAAGDSRDVSFSVTREDPGDYTADVDGLSGSFTVVAPEEEEEEEEVPTKPGINWPLIGGIIGGVIVVGLGVFFWMRRRRAA